MKWKMEMDVQGVSPRPEPIPPAAGAPPQRPPARDGQPAEPPPAESGPPERRLGADKEDKKASAPKHSEFHWAWCLLMTTKPTEANSTGDGRSMVVDPLHI
ncbi:uncharacterized protein [Phaenicophaeus curvirostris]|uniref:uncharacterized protein n=1 Tax=Phaenicophaeus curvirostris TaxID=33595 RepID=UPI0037F0DA37